MSFCPPGRCLERQVSVAHSWPKRRFDVWLNHAEPAWRPSKKYLQMMMLRGVRRQALRCLTRPVTPEVAGSSPVAPALYTSHLQGFLVGAFRRTAQRPSLAGRRRHDLGQAADLGSPRGRGSRVDDARKPHQPVRIQLERWADRL